MDDADAVKARSELRIVGAYVAVALLDTLAIDSRNLELIAENEEAPFALSALLRAPGSDTMVTEVARDVIERLAHGPVSAVLLERFNDTVVWLAKETELQAMRSSDASEMNRATAICFGLSTVSGLSKALTSSSGCCDAVVYLAVQLLVDRTEADAHIAQVLFLVHIVCTRVPVLMRKNRIFISSLLRRVVECDDISFGVSALIELHRHRPLTDFYDELDRICSLCAPQVREHIQAILSDINLHSVADINCNA
eukprot:IDg9596t1